MKTTMYEKYFIAASYFVKSLTNKAATLYDRIELKDFLVRGGVIGEMSTLTGKPGHKTFRCATYVEVSVWVQNLPIRYKETLIFGKIICNNISKQLLIAYKSMKWQNMKTFPLKACRINVLNNVITQRKYFEKIENFNNAFFTWWSCWIKEAD